MTWCAPLLGERPSIKWTGSASQHLKFSGKQREPKLLLRCSKCQRELPATKEFFYERRGRERGLQSECKVCHGSYAQAKLTRLRNAPTVLSTTELGAMFAHFFGGERNPWRV